LSSAISTGQPVSFMCGGRSETDGSSAPRPRAASAPCRSRQSRSTRLSNFRRGQAQTFSFHRYAAPTSISTTSAPESGNPPNSQPGSHRSAASTISGTRSRPSRCVPASQPSTSPATWAPALTMIDRHCGHLARDGRDRAINLLDRHACTDEASVHRVDIAWTPSPTSRRHRSHQKRLIAGENRKPSDGLEPSTPSLPFPSERQRFVARRRACRLMCPFCVRGLVSCRTTGSLLKRGVPALSGSGLPLEVMPTATAAAASATSVTSAA
jgi:hypothetical protein